MSLVVFSFHAPFKLTEFNILSPLIVPWRFVIMNGLEIFQRSETINVFLYIMLFIVPNAISESFVISTMQYTIAVDKIKHAEINKNTIILIKISRYFDANSCSIWYKL